jgi:hypothetical protein
MPKKGRATVLGFGLGRARLSGLRAFSSRCRKGSGGCGFLASIRCTRFPQSIGGGDQSDQAGIARTSLALADQLLLREHQHPRERLEFSRDLKSQGHDLRHQQSVGVHPGADSSGRSILSR